MKHHLLSSYFHAVLSVALAQFGKNGFPDGVAGIIRLAEASPYFQARHISLQGSAHALLLAHNKVFCEVGALTMHS